MKRFREQIEKEKQAYGSCSRQKEYDVIVFVHGDIRPTVEKELSAMAVQFWTEGTWTRQWSHEQKQACLRQVRGLAGAVMCEIRDLGIKRPHWHTLVLSDEIKINMGYVCPKDVTKMLAQRAHSVYWKTWAAKHEHEESKEGGWLERELTLSRKKEKGDWTEGGWTQKRLFDIGWSDVSQCQACPLEKVTEKPRLHHCPEWHAVRRGIPEAFRKWEQKAKTSKKEWNWQRGIVELPLSGSQWNRGTFRMNT